jgi:hypothetical protein
MVTIRVFQTLTPAPVASAAFLFATNFRIRPDWVGKSVVAADSGRCGPISCVYNCCGMNDSRDVPATELRANLASFLDEARSGVEFRITRNGNRVAVTEVEDQ